MQTPESSQAEASSQYGSNDFPQQGQSGSHDQSNKSTFEVPTDLLIENSSNSENSRDDETHSTHETSPSHHNEARGHNNAERMSNYSNADPYHAWQHYAGTSSGDFDANNLRIEDLDCYDPSEQPYEHHRSGQPYGDYWYQQQYGEQARHSGSREEAHHNAGTSSKHNTQEITLQQTHNKLVKLKKHKAINIAHDAK